MDTNITKRPNALATYTVIMLRYQHTYLLPHRSPTKRIWPDLWTGVGGRVEDDEYTDLRRLALRELEEETGITSQDVSQFILRRVLLHARANSPLTMLLYYTGTLSEQLLPPCTEGELSWVSADEVSSLAVVGSTRPVLPLLIADCERDPDGVEAVRLGIANFQADGEVADMAWLEQGS